MSASLNWMQWHCCYQQIFLCYFIVLGMLPILECLIVPQQLPTILSLVYSNIPPIKKGTDSRLGFGFRLGEHADFQILLELGPQKETRPIGEEQNNSQNSNVFRKRHVSKQEELEFYQNEGQNKLGESGNWLQKWYQQVQANKLIPIQKTTKNIEPSVKSVQNALIKDKSLQLPDKPILLNRNTDIVKHLQQLYELADRNVSAMEKNVANKNIIEKNDITNNSSNYLSQHQTLILPSKSNKESWTSEQPEVISETKTKRKISEKLMDIRLDK